MKKLATLFDIEKPKFSNYHEFQICGKEMTDYFGKSCYWLFTKYNHEKIKDAFTICKNRGVTDLKYCIGIIRKLQ